jgi:ABC-2 type transport system ATP-binding protein
VIAALEINGLAVAHGNKTVFRNLSLHVQPGEIFGLIGVNGAGKTSMMKAALRLLEPEAGKVQFFGVPHKTPESRRQVAYLPENFRPPSSLTGVQFLRLVLGFHNLNLDRARADQLAAAVDLEPDALSRRIATLSKGMSQKIGLLATFLTQCPLLILDEPMSGLDPRARIKLKVQMQAYRAENNAIFLSSHILTDLEELCDRIAVLHNAMICFTGAPEQLCAQQNQPTLERAFISIIEQAPAA